MEIKDAKVGMKIRNTYTDMGIGTITAIGKGTLLATFPTEHNCNCEVEIKVDPDLYEEYTEDKPHTYTVTLNCKDNKTVSAVFMKDGVIIGTESVTAASQKDFELNDGLSVCLEALLENIGL